MTQPTPTLIFHFNDPKLPIHNSPLCFTHPKQIITTDSLDQVRDALRNVQQAVADGNYAAGFITYEAAPAFDPSLSVRPKGKMPSLWFGIFSKPSDIPMNESSGFHLTEWKPRIQKEAYENNIEKIKEAIQQGITYQVNLTMRLSASFTGSPLSFYDQLIEAQQAPYGAFLHTGRHQILSASHELFFAWDGQQIMTRPMKGTTHRGRWAQEDIAQRKWLQQSEKDQAENYMIVDLLRNDVAKIAKSGTVNVSSLVDIEPYPTVYQMTSTVTAQTRPLTTLEDIFTALFPCGSITGAPKGSTMKLIASLEESPREVYCGAIGLITPDQQAIFNVPIRTVVIDSQDHTASYGVGGGITWDSTSQGEYEEVQTKSKVLTNKRPSFELLESLLLDDGKWFLLNRHLHRLQQSAEYFAFPLSMEALRHQLQAVALEHPVGRYKVRVLLDAQGTMHWEKERLLPFQTLPQPVCLSSDPIDRQQPWFYHKTTYRKFYEQQREKTPHVFDVLLWNDQEELTEFTIGNLVVEWEGEKWTPPVSCGLLAGTYRAELLAQGGAIKERVLHKEQLFEFDRLWLINSVRHWVPVRLC